MVDINWFYIKHLGTNKTIASYSCQDDSIIDNAMPLMRSQVIVTKPTYSDNELWCWDDQQLRNKSTGLVLDIRKGRIRFMEDTEICLYYKKSREDSRNQLWAVQTEFQPAEHPLVRRRSSQKTPIGSVIYSVANSDWVLDVCPEGQKLVLFPYNQDSNHQQRWLFISEKEIVLTDEPTSLFDNKMADTSSYEAYYSTPISNRSCSSSTSSSQSTDSTGFAYGLTPAKRCSSQSSLPTSSRKSS